MTNDLTPHDGFEFDYPVWLLVAPSTTGAGSFNPLTIRNKGGGEQCALVFTDEDLAERYIAEAGKPGDATMKLKDAANFLTVLAVFSHTGITHVGFDCSRGRGVLVAADTIIGGILGE